MRTQRLMPLSLLLDDAADAAIQSDVDANEADSDSADAAIQADVDGNEADSDSADAAIQADVTRV